MSKNFLVDINLNGNELQNVVLQNLSASPANPVEGAYYYNTTDHKFYFYENNAWVKFATLSEFTSALALKLDVSTYNTDKAALEGDIEAAQAAADAAQDDIDAYKISNDAAVALKADDNAVVHLANAENVTGVKTFTNGLRSSETIATTSNDTTVATTAFVKSAITAAEGDIMHLSGEETVTGDKTFTGEVDLTSATVTVATAAAGDNSTAPASTAFVKNAIDTKDATVVHVSGNESIAGTKTFTGSIVATSATVTVKDQTSGDNSSNAANTKYVDAAAKVVQDDLDAYKTSNDAAVALKAADNAVVHLAGAETISGAKTFSASPIVPTASVNDSSTKAASTAFVANELVDYTYDKDTIDEKIAEKDSLPSQAEHAGEWLTTDGTDAAWSALPIATASTLGVVKVGTNLSIAVDGTISTTANVASVAGKTGVVTLDKSDVGLGNVDNTSDANKPISTATQAALDLKADAATTLAGYGITDAYTKTEIDGMVASTFHYKGTKTTYSQLPTTGQVVGDVWNIEQADPTHGVKAGDNVCWNGTSWDILAGVTDLSAYSTTAEIAQTYMNKTDLAATYLTQADAASTYATKEEVTEGSVHRTSQTNPALTPSSGVASWSISGLDADPYAITIIEVASGEEVVADIAYGTKSATIRMNASSAISAGTYKALILM
jgi:hypothetical protein